MKFYKYHGTGNDFIIINNFSGEIKNLTKETIKFLCDRHFGIGADGLIILNKHFEYDFEMDYYNADGSGATLCGNGGRCIVAFAKKAGIINEETEFLASDGLHQAKVNSSGIVELKMNDADKVSGAGEDYTCFTGSPHYITFVIELEKINVYNEGRNIRYSEKYKDSGTNVNFVEILNPVTINVRTYERGVENETLSCGTGSVASVLTHAQINNVASAQYTVNVKGGALKVRFEKKNEKFVNIYLIGSATFVFEGTVNLLAKGIK